jgi:mannose-1-phosphate guanylyltransferase
VNSATLRRHLFHIENRHSFCNALYLPAICIAYLRRVEQFLLSRAAMRGNLWSVVLAAGAGSRLARMTGGVPKQFWRPNDGPSLIESTIDRLAPICPSDRTIIVVGGAHRGHVRRWPKYRSQGRFAFQPDDRGTAAGLLFGLLPVLAADPDGVVVVTPADHGVRNSTIFRRGIVDAIAHAQHPGGVVIFGVEPDEPREDYGWITLDPAGSSGPIQAVASFVEKPALETTCRLLKSGAVWNSMVVVARARELIDLCRIQQGWLTAVFQHALALPPAARHEFLASSYPAIQPTDLSRDVLTHARGLWAYTWPAAMGWSDLGTPERFCRWALHRPSDQVSVAQGASDIG